MEQNDLQPLINLIKKAFNDGRDLQLLTLLLTHDERSALVTRIKIIDALLKGNISQQQLKDQLGTGIATVTRGSNGLKQIDADFKSWLIDALK